MFHMRRHYPVYAGIVIILVVLLIYLDNRTNIFSPYIDLTLNVHWNTEYQSLEPVDIVQVSEENNIKSYHLGFISDAGYCNPAWGGQPNFAVSQGWAKPTIDKMLANDLRLVIAFGGANSTDISAQCSEPELLAAYEKIIATYHPEGLEFNIENSTSNIPKTVEVLQDLQKKHPELEIIFTLHTLPEGITATSQKILFEATESGINYTANLLVMNYGPRYTGNMAEYAIQATHNLYNYLTKLYPHKTKADRWKMIEITPMIGLNDVPNEKFTLADADAINNFAKHFGLGEVSIWLANRDFPCDSKVVNNYCSGDNLQTKPYEYESRFTK